jgi:2-C-methyl-D-erythritol 4-phosphate cytidylyltransferase/2-C-methyl-D-erythritol 2,4-cyclodiphosphate synthase
MRVTAIIAAGGRGRRFGSHVPKQLLAVGDQPILQRSVALFVDHPQIDDVIVALPQELVNDPPPYLRHTSKPVRVVEGGPRRQDSVARAFAAVAKDADVVVIHDAARPFATSDLVSRTIDMAARSGAAVAAVPARDTVKRVGIPAGRDSAAASQPPAVLETLPRESIYLAQTPQAFRCDVLREALAMSAEREDATDEAQIVERAGFEVSLVHGEASNLKITTPEDVAAAAMLARQPSTSLGRIGTGYDLHRLVPGRPLTVGGIVIPADVGPVAHSDGDVVCHAVTDAILGAAALGDIGRHFPDTDPRWRNASSLDLLARVAAMLTERSLEVCNVDATVILEKPKLRDHVDAMCRAVAGALGIDHGLVSIKGKTNEGVDAVGRGEAIAAHAVALIR